VGLSFPDISLLPLERYTALLGAPRMQEIMKRIGVLRDMLAGRAVWNVNSSAVGGGVAEMVRSLLAYARGAGVDARWVVIGGPPEFFRLTKQLHNALHGSGTSELSLGRQERRLYERVSRDNAAELALMVRPGDVVIVHDPQPAGVVPWMSLLGARVIWRCHVGHDQENVQVERAWDFLAPYLDDADAYVFSRAAYVPPQLDAERAAIIPPSVDPFSAKNQALGDEAVRAILSHTGILRGPADLVPSLYLREDGTPGRVDRRAEVMCEGELPAWDAPMVAQVSRWDRLKDPIGVLDGFARLSDPATREAVLVLAGPGGRAIADDPEGAAVYDEVVRAWRGLPDPVRRRALLASLPSVDIEENAAIVNALQRHARVIVQKSLHEGFGLTVTEAMWKGRPVVASAVGGIRDQLEDGVEGLLLADPYDLDAFAVAVTRLLADPALSRRMGERGHARVLDRYLGIDSLLRYGALIEWLEAESATFRVRTAPPIPPSS
jgi:trehalose synthase